MATLDGSCKIQFCIGKRDVVFLRLVNIHINNTDPEANPKLVKVLLSILKSTSVL